MPKVQRIILALSLLIFVGVMPLAGCGSSSPANVDATTFATVLGSRYTGPFYVNATAGSDSNSGTSSSPFKTITKALNKSAARGGGTIYVAPGTYNAANGEVFPLVLSNNVNLIGDIPNKGATTFISGWGTYTLSGTTTIAWVSLVVPPGVSANISGLRIGRAYDVSVIIDGAPNVTLNSNNIDGTSGLSDGIWIGGGNPTVTLTNNIIRGANWWIGGLFVTDHSTVTLRGNSIQDSGLPSVIILGGGTALTSPVVDMGTATSQGLNSIIGPVASVGLSILNDPNTINVSGNTWKANIQGADALGHYTAGLLISSSTPLVAGNNYSATSLVGTSNIQFYSSSTGSGEWPVLLTPTRTK